MIVLAKAMFILFAFLLFYTWMGYFALMWLAFHMRRRFWKKGCFATAEEEKGRPSVSVVIAARNEEMTIRRRIENILRQSYAAEKVEVIVASDGSTDRTVSEAESFADDRVRILAFPTNRGRATVHNESVRVASGDIVVFTDAETTFETSFLENIVTPFRNREVGAVVGRLVYENTDESGVTRSAEKYWGFETRLRLYESSLGVLAFGSGACCAFRRDLYTPIGEAEDIDTAGTLDIARSGRKVIFSPEAIAYDTIAVDVRKTMRNRIRHTSKAFLMIRSRLLSKGILSRPFLLLAILSHKTCRHMSPVFLLGSLLANIVAAGSGLGFKCSLVAQVAFYCTGIAGVLLNRRKNTPMLTTYCGNFLLFNLSQIRALGAVLGRRVSATY